MYRMLKTTLFICKENFNYVITFKAQFLLIDKYGTPELSYGICFHYIAK